MLKTVSVKPESSNQDGAIAAVRREAASRFDLAPDDLTVVKAPYRICPLGAHVDHQLGSVTAMAIDRAVHLAAAPSNSREVRLASLSFPGEIRFSIDDVPERISGDWGNYIRGAVHSLAQRYPLKQGIVGVTSGDLAEGGLSSSAAFGVACLLALEKVNGLDISPEENIVLDQQIENNYLGVRNGILDQAAVLLSKRGRLTLLDCRTKQHELILPGTKLPQFTILLAFSGLTKSLVTTDYNRRVEECTEAARALLSAGGRGGETPLLGNVTAAEYEQHKHRLTEACARRAEHFFSECRRVQEGVVAWREGDLVKFGKLMSESCYSSLHNYECGATPLVVLYELLASMPGVYGVRFSGAGFRGCCVALVDSTAAESIAETVDRQYKERIPEFAARSGMLLCEPDDGARIL